ncbi:MAG TPA: hypothetical protein VFD91_05870 [Mariniphaga sp.]|nr:hypothetical protein [Mariniphaga sp.]
MNNNELIKELKDRWDNIDPLLVNIHNLNDEELKEFENRLMWLGLALSYLEGDKNK